MKLSEAMDMAETAILFDNLKLSKRSCALVRLRAEVNRLTARLERAEAKAQEMYDLACSRQKRLVEAERERDEARQLINALEKSAEKYEAWVDENMRMI